MLQKLKILQTLKILQPHVDQMSLEWWPSRREHIGANFAFRKLVSKLVH